jgi:hypothetical protein
MPISAPTPSFFVDSENEACPTAFTNETVSVGLTPRIPTPVGSAALRKITSASWQSCSLQVTYLPKPLGAWPTATVFDAGAVNPVAP